jgi:hypothetical protein
MPSFKAPSFKVSFSKAPSHKLCAFRLLTTLLAFAAGSQHGAGLKFIAQNLEIIGPRQWLGLVIAGTPVIAPVSQRLAGVMAWRAKSSATESFNDSETFDDTETSERIAA